MLNHTFSAAKKETCEAQNSNVTNQLIMNYLKTTATLENFNFVRSLSVLLSLISLRTCIKTKLELASNRFNALSCFD